MIFQIEEILRATGGRLIQGYENTIFHGISTDSRTLQPGELFIPLKGARYDGHDFLREALEKKASGVLVEEEKVGDFRWNGYRSKAVISVRDTLRALGDIAKYRRGKFKSKVIGLTGSNGKTTSKEMISVCLETTYKTLKTEGNLNNLIGLPLTLLKLDETKEVVILEMGMNVPGEVRRLTEIAQPDVGLITNIQKAHLEGMGNLERIKEEKGELFRGIKDRGTIIVNQDDPMVIDLARNFLGQKITFGIENSADLMARDIKLRGKSGTSFHLVFKEKEMEVEIPLLGRHFVYNALSAIASAIIFGIELERVRETLKRFKSIPMRMEIIELREGIFIINDTYNANPRSMELALETLSEMRGKGRAIAVLGDMLELGTYSNEAHRDLGMKVSKFSIDFLIALGEEAPVVVESAIRHGLGLEKAMVVESHQEAISILKNTIKQGDWILVKGSRGMRMEKIVKGLLEGEA